MSVEDRNIKNSISDNVITNPPALWSPLRENRRNQGQELLSRAKLVLVAGQKIQYRNESLSPTL